MTLGVVFGETIEELGERERPLTAGGRTSSFALRSKSAIDPRNRSHVSNSNSLPNVSCKHATFPDRQLCPACFRIADKNENANWTRERSAHSARVTNTLHQYQNFRNEEWKRNQREREQDTRDNNVKIANFNKGVSDAKKAFHSIKPPFQKMFVLQNRPVTAVAYRGVAERYGSQLRQQIADNHRRRSTEARNEFQRDKNQQEFLRRQLSAQMRNQKLQDIQAKTSMREALEHQVATQTPQLPFAPSCQTAVFGAPGESDESRRKRARQLAEEQLDLAITRKQTELIKDLIDEHEQQETNRRNKSELKADMLNRQQHRKNVQKHLDREWMKQMGEKQLREQREVRHLLRPGGAAIIEQCAHYPRCSQCYKRINNRGKSNIFKDVSAYTSGARFMT